MNAPSLKNLFLKALIVSVCISVVIGILVVLRGTQEQSTRIFLTSLTITIASFSLFINGVFFERLLGKVLPLLGFVITIACALLCVVNIWNGYEKLAPLATASGLLAANFSLYPLAFYHEKKKANVIPILGLIGTLIVTGLAISMIWELGSLSENVTRFFSVCYLLALACFYLSLILQVNLTSKFAWALTAAKIVTWLLFACGAMFILISDSSESSFAEGLLIQGITILSILITALTVLVPIFYFLGKIPAEPKPLQTVVEIDREIDELKFRITELEELRARIENPASTIS